MPIIITPINKKDKKDKKSNVDPDQKEFRKKAKNFKGDPDQKEFQESLKNFENPKSKNMNMGGEVMNTTKAMPVDMMDGGKVKPMKMNMGGVIPGRGGMFKGMK